MYDPYTNVIYSIYICYIELLSYSIIISIYIIDVCARSCRSVGVYTLYNYITHILVITHIICIGMKNNQVNTYTSTYYTQE